MMWGGTRGLFWLASVAGWEVQSAGSCFTWGVGWSFVSEVVQSK